MRTRQWTPVLKHFDRHSDYQDCLQVIWRNVGASGLDVEELLLPYQRHLFRDLSDGLDEHALATLYDWWEYDLEELFRRGRMWRRDLPAKPRIRIYMERTTKGNFKCEWWPVGVDNFGGREFGDAPDWRSWHRFENRSGGWDSRPSNELIFIHDIDHALITIRGLKRSPRPVETLDHVLLQGIAGLVGQLKARLERHFEVVMLRDLFLIWTPEEWSWHGEDRMAKWEIDDPSKRQNEAEVAELASVKERLGFTETHFEELWAACAQKKRSGPAPAPRNVSTRVAKALREQGFSHITSGDTDRLRFLIEKHRHGGLRRGKSAEVIAFPERD